VSTKKDIESKAREYVGTRFQHQGRLKGRAMDCVGLPLCVADDLGLVDKLGVPFKKHDNANYSAQPLDRFVHEEAQRRMIEKPIDQMQPGDLVTIRLPDVPCHVAIISTVNGTIGMIHAYATIGKVVEHIMDVKWRRRIEGCFAFPGVE